MAYSHSKLFGLPLPPVSGETELVTNRLVMVAAKTRVVPLQVRRKQEQNLQAPRIISISRRDAMLYTAAEVVSRLTFLSAEPAEARVGKLEGKKRIMEKLEKLREEAGVSKPKTQKMITSPEAAPPPPPMNRRQVTVGPVVEAILP